MREKLIELVQSAVGGCDTYWAGLIADHLIANGVRLAENQATSDKASKWIPVTEMVPESHVEQFEDVDGTHYFVVSDFVLGYTQDGNMVTVQHEVSDDREWWNDMFGGTHIVTHWMPLPEVPKGE